MTKNIVIQLPLYTPSNHIFHQLLVCIQTSHKLVHIHQRSHQTTQFHSYSSTGGNSTFRNSMKFGLLRSPMLLSIAFATSLTCYKPTNGWIVQQFPQRCSLYQNTRKLYRPKRTITNQLPYVLRYNSHRYTSSTSSRASIISNIDEATLMSNSKEPLSTLSSNHDPALGNNRKIAEGIVVAQYPNGFIAVRITDDSIDDKAIKLQAPTIVGTQQAQNPIMGINSKVSGNISIPSSSSMTTYDLQGKQVIYPNGSMGVVVAHRPPLIFCYSSEDNSSSSASEGMVQVYENLVKIHVTSKYIDCFGHLLDTQSNDEIDSTQQQPQTNLIQDISSQDTMNCSIEREIFSPIPKISQISLINHPMLTGNTMIDTIAPIGRGQNMLLVGSNIEELRHIALGCVKTQVEQNLKQQKSASQPPTICVYASTEPNQQLAYERILKAGIADNIYFVGTRSKMAVDSSSLTVRNDISHNAQELLVAHTACSIAEGHALRDGSHALVVVDNIDSMKDLWDTTTRIMVDTFGIQSVVDPSSSSSSEMRGYYSSLIQRAGQYNQNMGGGSVTILLLTTRPPTSTVNLDNDTDSPVTFRLSDFAQCSESIKERIKILERKGIELNAATLRKINIPIPTASEINRRMVLNHIDELISMTDGQIWLDEALSQYQQPPIDPQRSITRIGIGADTPSRADAKAIRRIGEGVRLELAQAADSITAAGSDHNNHNTASQKQQRRKLALLLAMYQPIGSKNRKLSESCTVLLAAKNGYLDEFIDRGVILGSMDGTTLIQNLLDHMNMVSGDIMNEIDMTFDISDSARSQLSKSIVDYFSNL